MTPHRASRPFTSINVLSAGIGVLGAGMAFLGALGVVGAGIGIVGAGIGVLGTGMAFLGAMQSHKALEAKEQVIAGLLERQRPRQLTPEQEEQFVHILRGAPKGSIMVDSLADSEPMSLAIKMKTLFQAAGWAVGGQPGVAVFDPPIVGVELAVDHPDSADPKVAAIQQAFGAVGIPVKISDQPSPTANWFMLSVGPKH